MFGFSGEQKEIEFRQYPPELSFKVGGQPGKNPPLLLGTLFYPKQFEIVGESELNRARQLLRIQDSWMKETGISAVPDFFIKDEERLRIAVSFIKENLKERFFSLDIPEIKIRKLALKYMHQEGLSKYCIYNSINISIDEEEIMLLKQHPPYAAILLAYNPKNFSSDGRAELLATGGGFISRGLIELAAECNISNLLLDTAATPFGHYAAESLRTIPLFKAKWGLPTGCAVHNTVESWNWLRKIKKTGEEGKFLYKVCDISSLSLPLILGGDFVLYGPIDNAPAALTAAAMVSKFVAEGARDYFGVDIAQNHPSVKLE